MDEVKIANSDLAISPVGFGAWAIGGNWKFGWGAQKERDSVAAIRRALELGVNWIDTAPAYGLGHSEAMVARALRGWTGPRPYVFTKCGIVWNERKKIGFSAKASSIRREVEASLRRLETEVIDLYQMHRPMKEDAETLEGWSEMAKLKEEGKVRWIGVSNFDTELLEKATAVAPVTSLQPPYSLLKRKIETNLLRWCADKGVGVIVYSPMGSGLLTGAMTRERAANLPPADWRSRSPEFREPQLSRNLQLVERLKAVATQRVCTPGAVAVAWTLRRPEVTAAIVGGRNPVQVEGIAGAPNLCLTAEEVCYLEGLPQ